MRRRAIKAIVAEQAEVKTTLKPGDIQTLERSGWIVGRVDELNVLVLFPPGRCDCDAVTFDVEHNVVTGPRRLIELFLALVERNAEAEGNT